MGFKILIVVFIVAIIWSIVKWTAKNVGNVWGLKNEQAIGFGVVLLGASVYILFKYGEQGFLLYATILTLIFFALKQFIFHSNEQFKREDDKNYTLVLERYNNGLSNIQIAAETNLSISDVDLTIRKIAFHKVILAYNAPHQTAEELASEFNIPVDYATKWLHWRRSGGDIKEALDPVFVFYFFVSGYLIFKGYGFMEQYIQNETLLYFVCAITYALLMVAFGLGYMKIGKKFFTTLAYVLLLFLIAYQIYLRKGT